MIINLENYYHDIDSEFGEDGIMYCLLKAIGHYKIPSYLNLCKDGVSSTIINRFHFVSIVDEPMNHTMDDIQYRPLRFPVLDLVKVNTGGVDYWLLRALLDRVHPNIICCRFNHVIPVEKSVTVPYVPEYKRTELFDVNYNGVSLGALKTLLSKHDYQFVGVSRFAVFAFYVKRELIPIHYKFIVPDLNEIPAIRYALTKRWPLVSSRFWIQVK